jgi:hypothetical protein
VAVSAGLLLLLLWRGRSTHELLVLWTIAGFSMMVWPLVGSEAIVRRRLIAAGAVLLTVVLVAWRLDVHANLGVLALAGNGAAVVVLSMLSAVLGALTGSRRWLLVQSGIWCVAIAGSSWWLALQSNAQELLSEWRRFLPDKQLMEIIAAPTPQPFDSADAIMLSIVSAGLFATSAYAGLLIRRVIVDGFAVIHLSLTGVAAVGTWLSVLLWVVVLRGNAGVIIVLWLMLLAIIAGGSARFSRELAVYPLALASVVLSLGALIVARDGLRSWWGPLACDYFLNLGCTPSQQAPWLIAGCAILLFAAAVGHVGMRLIGTLAH